MFWKNDWRRWKAAAAADAAKNLAEGDEAGPAQKAAENATNHATKAEAFQAPANKARDAAIKSATDAETEADGARKKVK